MKTQILLILILCCLSSIKARIIYNPADSIKIEQLLREELSSQKQKNHIIFYGIKFKGCPYVAQTLERTYLKDPKATKEDLIIKTNGFDCTTYVETVLSLVKTLSDKHATFKDFCRNLKLFRYKNGIMQDYTSRNHYFTSWIDNALNQKLISDLYYTEPVAFKAREQKIDFMSKHTHLYPAINGTNHNYKSKIQEEEKRISRKIYYIPTDYIKTHSLNFIKDGDIIAFETIKRGLDISHIGFAVRKNDGKLHLLNASSLYKKVVLDEQSIYQYIKKQKHVIGIRVFRLNSNIK